MRLTRARVTNYRSIDDSGWVSLDNVTCMVGKNESGKTAFLQALRRINPVSETNGAFDLRDFPRKGYVRYKRRQDRTSPRLNSSPHAYLVCLLLLVKTNNLQAYS